MNNNLDSKALSGEKVALYGSGGITIFESQYDFEDSSVPAKSIFLCSRSAENLRDFLNEKYPGESQGEELNEALAILNDLTTKLLSGPVYTRSNIANYAKKAAMLIEQYLGRKQGVE